MVAVLSPLRNTDQIRDVRVVTACVYITSCSDVTVAAFSAVNRSKMAYRKPRSKRRSISWIKTLKYLWTTYNIRYILYNGTDTSEIQAQRNKEIYLMRRMSECPAALVMRLRSVNGFASLKEKRHFIWLIQQCLDKLNGFVCCEC